MNQDWFEMRVLRRRKLNSAVWIPLRASQVIEKIGRYGYPGYKEEFFGAGTLAVPQQHRKEAENLGWMSLGIGHDHAPYVQDGNYVSADVYEVGESAGINLVLAQRGNSIESTTWYLHPDLVLGLRLKQENDAWVSIEEGYDVVARLTRDEDEVPVLLEIRSEHLKDFLAASQTALYATSYRSRRIISESTSIVSWKSDSVQENEEGSQWKGRISEIHEGGFLYGEETAVSRVSRMDVDFEEEVPLMPLPTQGSEEVESWTFKRAGSKLFYIEGELWRDEWVEPGAYSPRIRGDQRPSNVQFIIDAEGNQASGDTLTEGGRWLWFRPEVIMGIAHRRGGALRWYTQDTGGVAYSPGSGVHFGVNSLGLVNAYAKDIAILPEWQQRIWSGYNIGPDGGVSSELLASQVKSKPADTQAPEAFLVSGLNLLNELSSQHLGFQLLRTHEQVPEILQRTHRFRAIDQAGLLALAKDVARLTADSIDAATVNDFLSLPKKDRPGSLKSLENLLATRVDPTQARLFVGPLVGAYEMRHGDAHLAGSEINNALQLAGVDSNHPFVIQGFHLLQSCASSISAIAKVLQNWNVEKTSEQA